MFSDPLPLSRRLPPWHKRTNPVLRFVHFRILQEQGLVRLGTESILDAFDKCNDIINRENINLILCRSQSHF